MFNSVPRIVYYTVKRFLMIIGIIVLIAGAVMGMVVLSEKVGPWIVFPVFGLGYCIFMSYHMAKFDVEREKLQQERVERSLKKDW